MARDTLVLHGAFQRALLAKAIEGSYVEDHPVSQEEPEFAGLAEWTYKTLYKRSRHKTNVLQMLLLYDKIVMVAPPIEFEYARLLSTGLFEILSQDDEPALLGDGIQDYSEGQAALLKPLVIEHLVKATPDAEARSIRAAGLTSRAYYEALYDSGLLPTTRLESKKQERAREMTFKYIEKIASRKGFEDVMWQRARGMRPSRQEDSKNVYRFAAVMEVQQAYGTLCALLDLAVRKGAVLLQNDYDAERIATIVQQPLQGPFRSDAYVLLKNEWSALVPTLPKLTSIDDVLRIRDSNHRQIRRLREILDELELYLRDSDIRASRRAARHAQAALSDLNRGRLLARVGKYQSLIAAPFAVSTSGIAQAIGITSTVIGLAMIAAEERSERLHGWSSVIR